MLRDLLNREFAALAATEQRTRIRLEGPDIALPKSLVQTLSMALHELATNATKYGALVNNAGRVIVKWHEFRSKAGKRLYVDWVEEGLDLDRELEGPMTHGFGRQLIEEALPYSHGARTSFELRRSGVRCTIDIPLNDTAAEP